METHTVMMPRSLTAENDAKAAMSGEFHEDIELICTACAYDEPQDDCEVCGGETRYTQRISVSWTTIKEIYAKAVKELGV